MKHLHPKKDMTWYSHIERVLGVATRVLVTSDGATNAEAPEAQATAITADFILQYNGLISYRSKLHVVNRDVCAEEAATKPSCVR